MHNQGKWNPDGPWLPIEFARTSALNREDEQPYLSLVLHPNAGLIRTYWDMSLLTDLNQAVHDLRNRERCNLSRIAYLPRDRQLVSSPIPGVDQRILEWLNTKKGEMEAVIWTNLEWSLEGRTSFTIEDSIRWLSDLERKDAAEEYIRKAPSQTHTCLRRQVRERLGWKDIPIGF